MTHKRRASTHDTADSKRARTAKSGRARPGAKDSEDAGPDAENDEPDEEEDEDEDDDDYGEEDGGRRSQARARSASLFGLRLRTWLLLGGVAALAGYYVLDHYEPPVRAPETGDVARADITLVTADRRDLDCMAASGVGAYQCGFASETAQNAVDERHRLRPFMTLDRTLYLIPGLFLEPAIEARYKEEPPDRPRDQLKRFTAKCRVKLTGKLNGVRLRWRPDAAWQPKTNGVRVGTVSGCRVVPHERSR
ncbi:MAG: hypothetical protein JW940_22155 [Polyangiaceae bacterium]|nr:hypothetical protein [Polyangiaceae bacterium]